MDTFTAYSVLQVHIFFESEFPREGSIALPILIFHKLKEVFYQILPGRTTTATISKFVTMWNIFFHVS